ncbi:unnamed protein product [Rangifer tarandus platyrhynchus]|uniref:Uncharacterized protein n=1 Tax=Rangifer tarandus platyrhynchus TaxID=3082113 RepID=A0AC60A4G0_RANTA
MSSCSVVTARVRQRRVMPLRKDLAVFLLRRPLPPLCQLLPLLLLGIPPAHLGPPPPDPLHMLSSCCRASPIISFQSQFELSLAPGSKLPPAA